MKLIKLLIMLLLTFSVACTPKILIEKEPEIEFYTPIETSLKNEVDISLQIMSKNGDFDADLEFDAKMQLFDTNDELRAEADLPQNPFMKSGEIYHLITWRGVLEPGKYQLEWGAPGYGGTISTFEVVILDSGRISIGDQSNTPMSTN